MSDFVSGTHALYYYLTAGPRLEENARAALLAANQGQGIVYIPSIVIAELYYLNVKLGQPLDFAQELQKLAPQASFGSWILRRQISCGSMHYRRSQKCMIESWPESPMRWACPFSPATSRFSTAA